MTDEIFQLLLKTYNKSYNVPEACKRQNLNEKMIEELRIKIMTSKFVPKVIMNSQLLLFLNASNGDVDRAAEQIDKYYEVKHESPEFFKDRSFETKKVQKSLHNLVLVNLPITPSNSFLFCQRLRTFDANDYSFDGACKTLIMKVEANAFKHGPRDGIIYINDLDGMKFSHMFRPKISSVKKSLKFLQEGSPIQTKAVHILNCVPFISKVFAIAKPYMGSDLINRIHFHPRGLNFEEFQEKFGIPKSHLPSDYGGDLPSLEEIHMKQQEEMIEMQDYFMLEENQLNYEYDHLLEEIETEQSNGSLPR